MKVYVVIHAFDGGHTIYGVFASKADAYREVRKPLSIYPHNWKCMPGGDIWVNSYLPDVLFINEQDLTIDNSKKETEFEVDDFNKFLEEAKRIVNSWPKWKRNVLRKINDSI